MRLVATLRVGERGEDVALLAVASGGELAIDLRLGALVDQVLGPASSVTTRGFCGRAQ